MLTSINPTVALEGAVDLVAAAAHILSIKVDMVLLSIP